MFEYTSPHSTNCLLCVYVCVREGVWAYSYTSIHNWIQCSSLRMKIGRCASLSSKLTHSVICPTLNMQVDQVWKTIDLITTESFFSNGLFVSQYSNTKRWQMWCLSIIFFHQTTQTPIFSRPIKHPFRHFFMGRNPLLARSSVFEEALMQSLRIICHPISKAVWAHFVAFFKLPWLAQGDDIITGQNKVTCFSKIFCLAQKGKMFTSTLLFDLYILYFGYFFKAQY